MPWLESWTTLLEWLGRQAIPEFVPGPVRRIHGTLGDEPRLQTTAELAARSALTAHENDYRTRHADLAQQLVDARQAADDVRHDMLFTSSTVLENAVSRVLTGAGCEVTPLDRLLTRTANADLLVAHGGRRRLVEVKSASGNAGEPLVDKVRRHLETWPQLRPEIQVEGITFIVNHQTNIRPLDRSAVAYSRREFVQWLTMPAITTLELFEAWRHSDFDAIGNAVFPRNTESRRIRGPARQRRNPTSDWPSAAAPPVARLDPQRAAPGVRRPVDRGGDNGSAHRTHRGCARTAGVSHIRHSRTPNFCTIRVGP